MAQTQTNANDGKAKAEARKAAAEVRKAEAEAQKQREAQELLDKRTAQLRDAESRLSELEGDERLARERGAKRSALADHLAGFYDEVDKLAKGRTMIEATPLVVDQANDIIRDAKSIIEGDVFLDRVKEFIPAGNNPVYPDVLVQMRNVQQALGRAEAPLEGNEKRARSLCRQARTIIAALEVFMEDPAAGAVMKDEVDAHIDGKLDDDWFVMSHDREFYFNFDRLDEVGINGALGSPKQHE